jgi:hypothetical protein
MSRLHQVVVDQTVGGVGGIEDRAGRGLQSRTRAAFSALITWWTPRFTGGDSARSGWSTGPTIRTICRFGGGPTLRSPTVDRDGGANVAERGGCVRTCGTGEPQPPHSAIPSSRERACRSGAVSAVRCARNHQLINALRRHSHPGRESRFDAGRRCTRAARCGRVVLGVPWIPVSQARAHRCRPPGHARLGRRRRNCHANCAR